MFGIALLPDNLLWLTVIKIVRLIKGYGEKTMRKVKEEKATMMRVVNKEQIKWVS